MGNTESNLDATYFSFVGFRWYFFSIVIIISFFFFFSPLVAESNPIKHEVSVIDWLLYKSSRVKQYMYCSSHAYMYLKCEIVIVVATQKRKKKKRRKINKRNKYRSENF